MRQLHRLLRPRRGDGTEDDRIYAPDAPRIDTIEARGLSWHHVQQPVSTDLAWLADRFPFHPLDLEDVASINQRPKLDVYDDYLFLVVQFPRFDKDSGRMHAAELDVFIGPDYVVTLPEEAIVPLPAMWERARDQPEVRDELFAGGSGRLLYEILDRCEDASFPMLGQLGFCATKAAYRSKPAE